MKFRGEYNVAFAARGKLSVNELDPPFGGVLNYVGGVDHAIVRSDCMHDVNPVGETCSSLVRKKLYRLLNSTR